MDKYDRLIEILKLMLERYEDQQSAAASRLECCRYSYYSGLVDAYTSIVRDLKAMIEEAEKECK